MNGHQPKKRVLTSPLNRGTSVQKPEEREKALYNIDRLITLLEFGEQLGANVTIHREDIPILLKALEPVIKERAEYWQRLQARLKKFNL